MHTQGWTLLDVRLEGDFEGNAAEGAINVPLFRYTAVSACAIGVAQSIADALQCRPGQHHLGYPWPVSHIWTV
jgi:hypothetical protein